ncbi:putative transcriptional regulator [Mycobacterium xenopi 3993]|nr:putative transcriptional regulator [Mycobacterium xenopi 3993]
MGEAFPAEGLPTTLEGFGPAASDRRPARRRVLPSLSLLAHTVRTAPADVSSLLEAGTADVVIVDARNDLPAARSLCRLLASTGRSMPLVAVVSEGGLVAVSPNGASTRSCCPAPDRPRSMRGCGWWSAAAAAWRTRRPPAK